MMADRLFDNETWIDFLRFNRKYRPDRLREVQTVKIIPDCCRHPGEITKARYEADVRADEAVSERASFCPWCGKWTKIRIA